jgi:hypothetical protein
MPSFGVEDPEGHQWYFAEAIKKARSADPKGPRRS